MKYILIAFLFIFIGCAKPESNIKKNDNSSSEDNTKKEEPIDKSPVDEVESPDEDTGSTPPEGTPITGNIVCYLGLLNNNNEACLFTTDINYIEAKNEYKYKNPSRFLTNPDQYRKPYHLLDLDQLDLLQYVSKNFQIGEFLVRFKGQYGILAPVLVEKLQSLRDSLKAPIHINSGYRSPAYNKSVGGANYSRHMYGDAVDMWSDERSLDDLKKECIEKGASFYQLYRTHIHCDWRNYELEPAFYPPLLEQPMDLNPMVIFQSQSELRVLNKKAVVEHPEAEEAHDDLRYDWTVVTKHKTYSITNYKPELNLRSYKNIEKIHVDIGGAVRVSWFAVSN